MIKFMELVSVIVKASSGERVREFHLSPDKTYDEIVEFLKLSELYPECFFDAIDEARKIDAKKRPARK